MIGPGVISLYMVDWGGRGRTADLKTASLSLGLSALMRAVRLRPLNKILLHNWLSIMQEKYTI